MIKPPHLLAALLIAAIQTAVAQQKPELPNLGIFAGTWRGVSSSGTNAEEIISAPEGGVMVSVGREFQDGKCVFYDLVVFAEKNGTVVLIPHPNGKRSQYVFPLIAFDGAAKRATFRDFDGALDDVPKVPSYSPVLLSLAAQCA